MIERLLRALAMPSTDSDSEDSARKRKKHKDKDKKKSHKEKKSHKRDKDDGGGKRHKKDKSEKSEATAEISVSNPISEDDYFAKSKEFQLWLHEARSTYLDEVSSEEARKLFKKFVAKWNTGALPPNVYAGGGGSDNAAANRTRHTWAFAAKLSDADQMQLDRTVDGVSNETNRDKTSGGSSKAGAMAPSSKPTAPRGPIGPSAGPSPAAAAAAAPSGGWVGPGRPPGQPGWTPSARPPPAAPQQARAGATGSSWDPEAFKRSMGM